MNIASAAKSSLLQDRISTHAIVTSLHLVTAHTDDLVNDLYGRIAHQRTSLYNGHIDSHSTNGVLPFSVSKYAREVHDV